MSVGSQHLQQEFQSSQSMSEVSTLEQVKVDEENHGNVETSAIKDDIKPPDSDRETSKSQQDTREVCRFYTRRRWCKFGNRCRNLHSAPSNNSESPTHQRKPGGRSKGQDIREPSEKSDAGCKNQEIGSSPEEAKGGSDGNGNSSDLHPPASKNKDEDGATSDKNGTEAQATSSKKYVPPHKLRAPPQTAATAVCNYFMRTGKCRYDTNCKFLHPTPEGLKTNPARDLDETENTQDALQQSANRKTQPVCKFFKIKGQCRYGEKCYYLHDISDSNPDSASTVKNNQQAEEEENQDVQSSSMKNKRPPVSQSQPYGLQKDYELSKMSEEELKSLRQTELSMIKKRYPQSTAVKDCDENSDGFQIKFIPSDPDWAYDVKHLILHIFFPKTYPKDSLKVLVPQEQELPETVRRITERSLHDWVVARVGAFLSRGRVELTVRPMLRWLDRNLEDVFTDALTHYKRELMAREAGIELVTAGELKQRYKQDADNESDEGEEEGQGEEQQEEGESEEGESSDYDSDDSQSTEGKLSTSKDDKERLVAAPNRTGTEAKLMNLQLREQVGTLLVTRIKMVLQCERCQGRTDLATPANRVLATECSRCHNVHLVRFRPTLVHQFSSVIGYLDLEGCSAFDLILPDSQFLVGCIGCNKEMHIKGLTPGVMSDTWCQTCRKKLRIAVESVRFQQLQTTDNLDIKHAQSIASSKIKKIIKDPSIQDGRPLPDNGTCKHYKKSFRWLRFPCCGKAYPCDICHDDKEFDHEFKFANRMICGFCAREQPYAGERPCVACHNYLTRKASEHWEGGKGCRDRLKMSRNDTQKYSNMNKTVSRKQKDKQDASRGKKKTLKLRHA